MGFTIQGGVFQEVLKNLKAPLKMLDSSQNFSARDLEEIYATGHGLYNSGNYEEASELFTMLVFSNPFEAKYWKGLASARQMEEKYDEALHAWCLAALLHPDDPLAHFHAAECFLTKNDKEEALKALNTAEKMLRTKTDESSLTLYSKIELLKQIHIETP